MQQLSTGQQIVSSRVYGEAATLCNSYLLDSRLYKTIQSLRRGCDAMQKLSTTQQIVLDNPESKERLQSCAAIIYWTTDCI